MVFTLKIGAFSRFKAASDRADLVYLSFVSLVPYEGRSEVLAESGPASEEIPPS